MKILLGIYLKTAYKHDQHLSFILPQIEDLFFPEYNIKSVYIPDKKFSITYKKTNRVTSCGVMVSMLD